jgi:hypothetical protein
LARNFAITSALWKIMAKEKQRKCKGLVVKKIKSCVKWAFKGELAYLSKTGIQTKK